MTFIHIIEHLLYAKHSSEFWDTPVTKGPSVRELTFQRRQFHGILQALVKKKKEKYCISL